MTFILLLALIIILDIGALVSARYYVEKKQKWIMWLSLITFGASGFVFVQLMAFRLTSIINVLYAAFSTIFVTFFYFVFFKERITKGQWLGIAVAFLGVFMLEM